MSISTFISFFGISISLMALTPTAEMTGFIDYDHCDFASTNEERVQWLEDILIDTQEVLVKYGVITWAVQSTLLGIVRDGRTMPWTWDVDLQTFTTNISTICQNTSQAHQELKAKGYRIHTCLPNFARVCKANRTKGPPRYVASNAIESRLDLYGATLRSDGLYDVAFSKCQWNLSTYLFPLKQYWWNNNTKSILGPNDYKYWLEMGYGRNWTIPEKYGGGRDDLC